MSLKLKIRSMFPALVSTTSPITLLKVGLAYTIGLDAAALQASVHNGADGILSNTRLAKTSGYTVDNLDKGKTIALGGAAFYALSFASPAVYDANFMVTVVNEDTGRGKKITCASGFSDFILWPGQSILVYNQNNTWQTLGRSRWKPPASSTLNFYTDFTNGTDTFGATDGLAPGASAFKSAERCFLNAADQIDFNAASQTTVLCNMAANTADTQGMHAPVHSMVGAQGGAAFQIVGASLAISGVVSNAGLCKITVPSTATYSANQAVSVYGVNGATGCNGTWKVTVTSGTELTLQGTTFGGAYTSGGAVTNGSSFNTTGNAIDTYFGTVVQFSNVTFVSTSNNLGVNWGSKVYLLNGNIFGSSGGAHIVLSAGSQLQLAGSVGISASATNAFLQVQGGGLFSTDVAHNIDFLPGVNPSFSGLGFVYVDSAGVANFGNVTINTNGNTVTGKRFNIAGPAYLGTGTGAASLTYFPGTLAGVYAAGSNYDTLAGTNLPTLTNTLGADVLLNNTANYFDGPSVAQGTVGTWFVSGTITLTGTASDNIICKLWDGTTVIASTSFIQIAAVGNKSGVSLSGVITSPAANLRISCRDISSTAGIIAKSDGINNNGSTISAFRIS